MITPLEIAGWTGQAMFFSRFLVQWAASERAGRSVAPVAFWWLSLVGTFLVGAYTWGRGEAVLLPVFCINTAVYLRNLLLYTERGRRLRLHPLMAAAAGVLGTVVLWISGGFEPREGLANEPLWMAIGVVGTAIWSSRFLLQWWTSERHGQSVFPISFWWTSLVGSVFLLSYALHLGDPLYIAAFAINPFVQVRNLMLEGKRRRNALVPRPDAAIEREPISSGRPSAAPVRQDQA